MNRMGYRNIFILFALPPVFMKQDPVTEGKFYDNHKILVCFNLKAIK